MFKSLIISLLAIAPAVLGGPALTQRDAWSDQVVSLHNQARSQYGAPSVTWDASLYPQTLAWAQQCKFQHSGGKYGENLYAATGNAKLADGINAWMAEASKYNYNNPGFSAATGHFTQVVWKSTTKVACALADCAPGTIFGQASKYLVCRYSPPGNVIGQFPMSGDTSNNIQTSETVTSCTSYTVC